MGQVSRRRFPSRRCAPTVAVAAFPAIVLAYTLLARKEERQMIERLGDTYRSYQRPVPMFIPRFDSGHRREA